ncbi:hypothetical protein LXL04_014182 [Taraxacum kok-saghyz]
MMAQPSVQLASMDEDKSLSQHKPQEIKISVASQVHLKPCPDLLSGSRKNYITTGIPLYEASIKGDWKTAKEILDKRPELVRYSITKNGETALHVAASAKNTKQAQDFVENLMTYMENRDLELENNNSNTALCLAAGAGNCYMVNLMLEKNSALVAITGCDNMPPLYIAALFGHYDVVKYLYDKSQKLNHDCWTPENRGWLLLKCVENDMFDIALKILQEHTELCSNGSVLLALAKKTDVFAERESNIIATTIRWVINPEKQFPKNERKANALELLRIIWQNIAEKPRPPDPPMKPDDKPPSEKEEETLELLKRICDGIDKMPLEIRNLIKEAPVVIQRDPIVTESKKFSSRIIFVAAEMGNTRFIIELIRHDPDLMWKLNDNNQSIFHTAVEHRHEGIYNLLHEIGAMKDQITHLKDKNNNNILHLVGKSATKKRLDDVYGAALQMQRELLWFKEVEKMIPPSYREHRNKEGLTPHELFTREHKELVKRGETWMKETASQGMVVAALIVTIVFAAAYTVPGGYNQDNGIPFFYQKETFIVFVVADAISLISSSVSVLMFLSVLPARYAERDFLESLPKKLMFGLGTLTLSITAMLIAFSISFYVLYYRGLKWIPVLITCFATMPVLIFGTWQYPLLKHGFRSTYGSRYLFRPMKRVLYN